MSLVALTGANGMTGRHMVSLFNDKDIAYKDINREIWDLAEWKSDDELDDIFGDVSAVFHFAACIPQNNSKKNKQIFDVNVRSCMNIAEWAYTRNVKIVFISSAVVYRNAHAINIKETNPIGFNNFGGFYGYTKILAESIFRNFSLVGLNSIILRPSSLYGYGLPSEKLLQNFIDRASLGKTINITEPNNKVNFVHAYDVANAALQAYIANKSGTFNIASKENKTILEAAENAVLLAGKGNIKIHKSNQDVNPYTRFDLNFNLANKTFRYEPAISLIDGMKLMKNKVFSKC